MSAGDAGDAGVTAGERRRSVAFVIEHAYVDALACFREPIRALADAGWEVDVLFGMSRTHPVPSFQHPRIQLIPIDRSRAGAVALTARLVARGRSYDAIFTVPQWSLWVTTQAARVTGAPVVCIQDEIRTDADATTPSQRRWRERERWAHRRCAATIALTDDRAAFIREENRLPDEHRMLVIPNASSGPARRLRSRFYHDVLDLPDDRFLVLHAGGMGWAPAQALARAGREWSAGDVVYVFQGRLRDQMDGWENAAHVRFADRVLPADLLDHAVSSAHVGLALYPSAKANDRLMGAASGKINLYLRNGLPVVATRLDCFRFIEEEGIGVLVDRIEEIPEAVARIRADYDRHAARALAYFDANLDFRRHVPELRALVEELAASRHAEVARAG